ncbi:hypothetical protein COB57_02920 [Candidatus Peregrinibacteria bacterium]|nr:MAG: hypothetical protein COB57_02920 [Candidatus Peregrinibacteria bacterium]
MQKTQNNGLYIFLSLHSFLIGLFPFFIPVFLWSMGMSLSDIAMFISYTGLSFLFSLFFWDHLRISYGIGGLVVVSFLAELLLFGVALFSSSSFFLLFFGIANGINNCFFWVTKRSLFLDDVTKNNTGKGFGNMQIIAFILVKIGILVGAFVLENYALSFLFAFVMTIISIGFLIFWFKFPSFQMSSDLHLAPRVSVKEIIMFRDVNFSKWIFLLDGPFLFFESYFWVLSLFFIVKESYSWLSVLSVVLAVSFVFIFSVIKNKIDHINLRSLYISVLLLYVLSWLLRGYILEVSSVAWLAVLIFTITFITSLFRLVFNKQFFLYAQQGNTHQYIMVKSYYSQFAIAVFFAALSYFFVQDIPAFDLQILYYCAGVISLFYGLYIFKP